MNVGSKQNIQCCGCTTCANVCPHSAITMVPDSLGFSYPIVNSDLCCDCGLCEKKCQFSDNYNVSSDPVKTKVYGVRNKDKNELLKSQSGAAFYSIAKVLLKSGYIVYGVGLDDNFMAVHKRVTTMEQLQGLRGSKYTQSQLGNTFASIKADLETKSKVLFSGTACQVAGLLSYLPKSLHSDLITVDIVCHGVPSPIIWKEYIRWIEDKYQSKVVSSVFRNKKYGWHSCRETFLLQNGKEVTRDTFRFFLMSDSHFATRPCCSHCPFTNFKRVSDITLGDFWGWEKTHSENCDNLGMSLMLVNTEKGCQVYNSIKSIIDSTVSNQDECMQPQLSQPVYIALDIADKFRHDFERHGFDYIIKKYANEGWKYKLRSWLSSIRHRL